MPALVGATPFWLATRFTQPAVMRMLAKRGADVRFTHRSETIVEKGFERRVDVIPPAMAALGMGGGTAWVQPQASDREALTLETLKVLKELGVDVSGGAALEKATAMKYESVVRLLQSTQTR